MILRPRSVAAGQVPQRDAGDPGGVQPRNQGLFFFDNFILLDQVLTGFSARAPDDAPYLVPLATTPSNHP